MTAQRLERQENVCNLCGLPGVQHANAARCVQALREECDQLRAHLAARNERDRGGPIGSRKICGVTGFCLVTVGTAVSLGKTLVHLAVALPLSELPMRGGFLAGLAAVLAGALLLSVAYGAPFRKTPTRRSPRAAVPDKHLQTPRTMPRPPLAA